MNTEGLSLSHRIAWKLVARASREQVKFDRAVKTRSVLNAQMSHEICNRIETAVRYLLSRMNRVA